MEKDFIWIIDCLESCKTKWQIEVVESMIALFHKKYKDGEKYYNHLIEALAAKLAGIDTHRNDNTKMNNIS